MINRKGMLRVLISAVFLLSIMPLTIHASVPQLINYQGKLMEDGAPTNGFRMMIFSIWDNDIGGDPASALWNETQTVEVTEGIYNVELGFNTALPANLYDYDDLFLQVDILHLTQGWQRLSPLMPFDSTVFAIKAAKAEDADTLDGKDSTELDQSTHLSDTDNPHSVTASQTGAAALSDITWGNLSNIPAGFADNVDNEGIATETDPTVASSVKDGVSWSELSGIPSGFADNVDNEGITTETDPTVLASVKDGVSWGELSGIPSGFADNVDDNSGGDITGVNAGIGLSGGGTSGTVTLDVDIPLVLTGSVNGGLIYGGNTYSSGYGLRGNATGSSGYGVYGDASGETGRGVYGYATGFSGRGVYGWATGAYGRGVYGAASYSGDVVNFGGYFRAAGASGRGVFGSATGTSGYGVYGDALGTSGHGVHGAASGATGMGVYGIASGNSATGVYGEATDTNSVTSKGGEFRSNGSGGIGVAGHAINAEGSYNWGGYFTAAGTSGRGVYAKSTGSGGIGVLAEATYEGDATNYGGVFYSRGETGRGVFGQAIGATGTGVYGYATGAIGTGVHGEATGTTGTGVYGFAQGTGSGVVGSATNRGVSGFADGATGRGVAGYADGATGTGVYGEARNGEYVTNYGGHFKAWGQYGIGVFGESKGLNGAGVEGEAFGFGDGVRGVAPDQYGRGVSGYGGEFDFYAGGSGTNYGPFTGAHEVRFTEDIPDEVRPGMIVSVTGRAEIRKKDNEDISLSSTLPTVALTGKAMDKAVLGVLISEGPLHKDHWYESQEGERFGVVNALGEGRMWVTNINGSIEAGDYITSSEIPGYGQMQNDDFLHSYTLGKAIETVDWGSVAETVEYNGVSYKVYLIAVVYTSG